MLVTESRAQLRARLRAARNALSAPQQQQAGAAIARQLFELTEVASARTVAAYLANDGEPSLGPTIEQAWLSHIQVTLPVLHPFTGKHLLFLQYHQHSVMTTNRFKIAEPALSCPAVVPLGKHDVILMPLVGFDTAGNRLGMGGGFYDRTLAALPDKHRPALIGIAHSCQQVDQLPVQNWDIPCDAIVTPHTCIRP